MYIMGNLRLYIRSLGERLDLFSYTKSQIIYAFYEQNITTKVGQKILIPLPLETSTQKILTKPQVIPKETETIKDNLNNYALGVVLRGADVNKIQWSMTIKQPPSVYKKKVNYLLADYHTPFQKEENKWINSKDPTIEGLSRKIIGSEDNVLHVIDLFYNYVVNTLTYGDPTEGLYSYKDSLERDRVDCGGFGTLLASLLGNVGIPNRLVVGFCTTDNKSNNLSMHAWNEAYLPDGSVFPLDPSIEWKRKRGQTNRWGGFGYIGSDRVVVSYGVNHHVKISNKEYTFPILQHPVFIE